MIHSNPYSRYAQQVETVAADLLDQAILPIETGATRNSFIELSDHVHGLVIGQLGQSVPEKLTSDQVRHGMRVIARFAYYATLRAGQNGLSSPTLLSSLLHPETFGQTLEPLALYDNEVTKRVERMYGLLAESDNPSPENRIDFMEDGSIKLNAITATLNYTAAMLPAEKNIRLRSNAICAAQRGRALEPLFTNVVPLYVLHPQLGGAIMPDSSHKLSSSI